MSDVTETELKVAGLYAEEQEQHRIEKDLLFWSRYAPGPHRLTVDVPRPATAADCPDWATIIKEAAVALREERERQPRIIVSPRLAAEARRAFGPAIDGYIVESEYIPKDTAYVCERHTVDFS